MRNLKMACYADYAQGKTNQIRYLIRAFGPKNVKIISADGGLITIDSDLEGVEVVHVTNLEQLRTETDKLSDSKWNRKDSWVVADGGTRMCKWIGDEHFENAQKVFVQRLSKLPVPPKMGKYQCCTTGGGNFDGQSVYGFIGKSIEGLIEVFMQLESNIYANFLAKETRTVEREKYPPWGPDCPGKIGVGAIMSAFDFVFNLRLDKVDGKDVCIARTRGGSQYLAKKRHDFEVLGTIPDEINEFNIAKFYQTIKEAKK